MQALWKQSWVVDCSSMGWCGGTFPRWHSKARKRGMRRAGGLASFSGCLFLFLKCSSDAKSQAVFQQSLHPTPPRSNQPLPAAHGAGTARRMLCHTKMSCGPSEKQTRVSVRALCPAFHPSANCVTFSHGFPSPI